MALYLAALLENEDNYLKFLLSALKKPLCILRCSQVVQADA